MEGRTFLGCTCRQRRFVVALGYALAWLAVSTGHAVEPAAAPAVSATDKWESAIAAFEKQDRQSPPKPGGVVFVGSSSIRLWDLPKSFPELGAINRGFGGSELADSTRYAPRIVIPYKPRWIVLYAGDNDLANGKTPETVAADFTAFVKTVHAALPETRIVYISIKPSIQRWKLIEKVRAANKQIAAQCQGKDKLTFVDVEPKMLAADGRPNPDLFVADGLHLNAKGYEGWAALLAPVLK